MSDVAPATHVLTNKTVVRCPHDGIGICAMPTQNWVRIGDDAVLTVADRHGVGGCAFNPPCTSIEWSKGSSSLSIDDKAVLVLSSVGTCLPSGGTAKIDASSVQTWVFGD